MLTRSIFAFALLATDVSAVVITSGSFSSYKFGRQSRPDSFDLGLSNGSWLYSFGDLSSIVSPPFCTGVCAFDFSQHMTGSAIAGFSGDPTFGRATFDLYIAGPVAVATAKCDPCLPGFTVYKTDWGPVPFTVTGTVVFTEGPPGFLAQAFNVSGIGVAIAENSAGYFLSTGYSMRYDFVPEVSGGEMLLLGFAFVAVSQALTRRRRARPSPAIPESVPPRPHPLC